MNIIDKQINEIFDIAKKVAVLPFKKAKDITFVTTPYKDLDQKNEWVIQVCKQIQNEHFEKIDTPVRVSNMKNIIQINTPVFKKLTYEGRVFFIMTMGFLRIQNNIADLCITMRYVYVDRNAFKFLVKKFLLTNKERLMKNILIDATKTFNFPLSYTNKARMDALFLLVKNELKKKNIKKIAKTKTKNK